MHIIEVNPDINKILNLCRENNLIKAISSPHSWFIFEGLLDNHLIGYNNLFGQKLTQCLF